MSVGKPFERGKSGNPGGRPNIAKLLDGFGKSSEALRAAMLKQAVELVEKGPKGTNDATWRYAHDWLAAHLGMRPRKDIDVTINEPGDDEIDIDAMSPDELAALERVLKRRLGLDEETDAGDPTVQ